jgi:methionyl-tRNA formyltransferase
VEVWQPRRPSEILAPLRRLAVDACAVVAYGALLPPDVLAAGGHGFVNLHFSLLPAWRGAAPVQHALLAGDAETGVTCFVLEEGMDTGPVLARAATPIGARETAGELVDRLAVLGAPVLVAALRGLVEGTATTVAQASHLATYASKISPDDARLDFRRCAAAVDRAVRAYNPVPGAWTDMGGQRLKIHRVEPGPAPGVAAPGTVVPGSSSAPVVVCGQGAVALLEVQPAGKPRMTGAEFRNGYHPDGRQLG